MYSKETIDIYVKAAAYVNGNYGAFTLPMHFLLVALLIVFSERAFSNPGRTTTIWLSVIIWISHIFNGVFTLLGMSVTGRVLGILSLPGSVILGGLIALPAFISGHHEFKLSDNPVQRICGLIFMIAGAGLYPLVELLTGIQYPGIVLIGAECPTYIFIIGLLIATMPHTNKILQAIIIAYGLVSSISAVSQKVWVDFIYVAACICGAVFFFRSISASYKKNRISTTENPK